MGPMKPGYSYQFRIRASIVGAAILPLVYGLTLPMAGPLSEIHGTPVSGLVFSLFGGGLLSNLLSFYLFTRSISAIASANFLFVVGLAIHSIARQPHLGRFLIGMAAGMAATTVPTYLNYVSPLETKGLVCSLYGPCMLGGLSSGFLLFHAGVPVALYAPMAMGLCLVSLGLLGWSISHRIEKDRLNGLSSLLLDPRARKSLLIACSGHLVHHMSGINHVLFNAKDVFPGVHDYNLLMGGISAAGLVTSCVSGVVKEYSGRKPLLLMSTLLVVISTLSIGLSFYSKVFSFLFIFGYNLGLSYIPFVFIGELFPMDQIWNGALFSTTCNWMGAMGSSAMIGLPVGWAFLMYILIGLAYLGIIVKFYKETKGEFPGYQ